MRAARQTLNWRGPPDLTINNKRSRLTDQEKSRRQLERELNKKRRAAEIARAKAAYYKKKAKEQDREMSRLLKLVRGKGIYDPKATTLTKYRKTRIGKIAKEFGDFFDITKFTFIAPAKKDKTKVLERAKNMELKTTKTGIFVAKEGNSKVKIKVDKKRDEFYIERSGKTKWGINQGKRYRTITPLAPLDALDNEIGRIKDLADKLMPLKPGERITFEVTEKGNEGWSHATFQSINQLLNHLDTYRKTIAAKLQFYRHIKIVKTSSIDIWFKEHPVKPPKKFSTRMHTRPFKAPNKTGR